MSKKTASEEKLDPRVKRTRALIEQAFMALLAEKGFSSITVQDITQRAEVNRATFYAHFADKYALLEAAIQHAFRLELEKRTLNACHFSEANLRALVVTVCEFISRSDAHCKTCDSQFETLVEKEVRRQIQELVELWLEQIGSEIDLKTAATAASWTIYGLALQWSREKGKPRPQAEQFAEQILPLVAVYFKPREVSKTAQG